MCQFVEAFFYSCSMCAAFELKDKHEFLLNGTFSLSLSLSLSTLLMRLWLRCFLFTLSLSFFLSISLSLSAFLSVFLSISLYLFCLSVSFNSSSKLFSNLCMHLTVSLRACGSVGRVVASDTRGPRFESSHQRIFI